MKKQSIFLTVLLTLTSFSLKISAEPIEHGGETVDTGKKRQEANLELSKKSVDFISSHFWTPSNVVEEKYGKKIPQAMDKAISGDESAISPILAKLMGTINPTQAERLLLDSAEIRAEELKKESRDDRYIGLMDRFIYASLKIVPELPHIEDPQKEELKQLGKTVKAEAFNKSFDAEMVKIKEQNEITLEKIKQAAEGNHEALAWIKKNLDQTTLLRWAEGQKKNGNSAAAEKLVHALSLKLGNQKVLDMWNGLESQRLFLGNSKESLAKALDGLFSSSMNGFGGSLVSYFPHPGNPNKQWFMDDAGIFTSGIPLTFTPNITNTPNPLPQNRPHPVPPSTQIPHSNENNANFNKFINIIQGKNCKTCHSEGDGMRGTSFSNLVITKGGVQRTLSAFLSNLDNMQAVFTRDQIEQLRRYAAAGN